MRDIFVFTMITKARPWRHIHDDIEIPKPKSHDIESRFQDQKTMASRFQDQKISVGIRVRIPQELDVVASWPWKLNVVVF